MTSTISNALKLCNSAAAVNFLRAFVIAPCGVKETPAALIPCTMKKKCHPSSDSVRSTANPSIVVRSFQGPYCFDAKWTDCGKRTAELIRTVPARMSSVVPMTSSTGIANLSTLAPGVSWPRVVSSKSRIAVCFVMIQITSSMISHFWLFEAAAPSPRQVQARFVGPSQQEPSTTESACFSTRLAERARFSGRSKTRALRLAAVWSQCRLCPHQMFEFADRLCDPYSSNGKLHPTGPTRVFTFARK